MCAPKKPKVEKTPVRMASVLPDGGDPSVRQNASSRRRLTTSSMIFTNQAKLGAPSVSGPIGTGGY